MCRRERWARLKVSSGLAPIRKLPASGVRFREPVIRRQSAASQWNFHFPQVKCENRLEHCALVHLSGHWPSTERLPGKVNQLFVDLSELIQQGRPADSKLQACMNRDHAWRAIGAQAHAEQSRWRRDGVGSRTESGLRRGLSWNTGQHDAR